MPPSIHVTTHIHTDGPIPGPHSLLTLASAAYHADGTPAGTFTANLRELPGATLHPTALADWRNRADEWLGTRRAARPPGDVVQAYVTWLSGLDGQPLLVTDPEEPDHLFCYWYLQRFAGRWPFAGIAPRSMGDDRMWSPPACPLVGCRTAVAVRSVPAPRSAGAVPALAG
ncbi:hypothetical protein [Pseudonocardia phyllosphaerae]|uniref:hypothetical protein n=1 Tax=Pseudonocardia phyllosphaerae TaxID=3390502 RepID=UPI00397AB3C1